MIAERPADRFIVLILDDDFAVRDSLKFALQIEGFTVLTYAHPDELLQDDSLPSPSCLIVDYHMPDMNGLDLIARLRARAIAIPAILVTVHPDDDMRARAEGLGVPIVEKPFLGPQLFKCVREAFGTFGNK